MSPKFTPDFCKWHKKTPFFRGLFLRNSLAERVGFEPTVPFRARLISSQ